MMILSTSYAHQVVHVDCPKFPSIQDRDPNLAAAVERSRQFYNLSTPFGCDLKMNESSMLRALVDGVEKEMFPSTVIGMYNGFYWPFVVAQEFGDNCPDVDEALTGLRRQMYGMILEKPDSCVREYKMNNGEMSFEQVSCRAYYVHNSISLGS